MFGKAKPTKYKLDTMIGTGTEISGHLLFSDLLVVDGTIRGDVTAEEKGPARLTLNRGGKIIGDIKVPDIYIDGEVEGDVYATERVELANNAQIKGNVYYNLLEMAMGAAINGNLVHKPKEEIRLLEHKAAEESQAKSQSSAKVAELKDAKS